MKTNTQTPRRFKITRPGKRTFYTDDDGEAAQKIMTLRDSNIEEFTLIDTQRGETRLYVKRSGEKNYRVRIGRIK